MKTFIITYNWGVAKLTEEVPAENPRRAKYLFLQKMTGNYTNEELSKEDFYIISVE